MVNFSYFIKIILGSTIILQFCRCGFGEGDRIVSNKIISNAGNVV